MKLSVTVTAVGTPQKSHQFVGRLHTHTSPETFFLDPEEFYKKWGKKVPKKHHELEILLPSVKDLKRVPLHVHESKKAPNLFVCYPFAIPTEEGAVEVFRVWCGGVVLTWEHKMDLNTIDTVCKGNRKQILQMLKTGYGIAVEGAIIC
jgi:hypothetical protein